MRMKILAFLSLFVFSGICLLSAIEAKDLYKILGVDKNASQRDIQKAFHRLSLKYHPDKNKAKDAQAKFSEINNAYEILSDEEKRKNYDLYGDEQGNQGFQGAGPENAGFGSQQFSYGGEQGAHFTFGGAKSRAGGGNEGFQYFNFPFERSSGSESGGSRTFRFSFGGPSMGDSFSMGDAFSSFFGFDFDNVNTRQRHANPFGGTGASKGSQTSEESYQIQSLDSASYASKVSNKGSTWLIMFYNPNSRGYQEMQEILDRLLPSFQGLVKIGTINCQRQHKLCKDLSVMPQKTPKLLIYSVRRDGRGSLLEYTGDLNVKDISRFCLDLLPMLSKRIDSDDLDDLLRASQKQLRLLLLTTKKKTPATWRALSGLFKDRVLFYDAEVPDPSHPIARKLGVKSLPGVLGILSNGEIVALGSEKMAKLAEMVETLEKKNAKVLKENRQSSKDPKETVPLLNKESVNNLCSSNTPLCVIGAFRSSKGNDKIKRFLKVISQKTLTRGGRPFEEVKDPLSYSLLDAAKQTTFLRAFDRSAFKGRDALLIAFKPKRKTFAVCLKPDSLEETENFVSEALNGDLQFTKVLQQPVLS